MTSGQQTVVEAAESEGWAVGSAVLALGADIDGVESLAVWHVSATGQPTGAWIEPCREVRSDRVAARRILALIERRALVAGSSAVVDEVVSALTVAAQVDVSLEWWSRHVVEPATVFSDIVGRRAEMEQTVTAAREAGRSVADILWSRDLTTAACSDMAELLAVARVAEPEGAAVVSEAISVARFLQWAVVTWKETEQLKSRRRYVEEALGPCEPLPTTWRAAVEAADGNRLPL